MSKLLDEAFSLRKFQILCRELLPDFQKDEYIIEPSGILNKIRQLGKSEVCNLVIWTVVVAERDENKRMEITQTILKVMRQHRIRNALIVVYANGETWRLSLLTSKVKVQDGKIINETSNPRRYSFLLGPKMKIKTPYKMLCERGRVQSLQELQERFSVEVVNKQFYKAIAAQYTKLVEGKSGRGKINRNDAPQLAMPSGHEQEAAEFAVRLIGRVIFCWFLMEKHSTAGKSLMAEEWFTIQKVEQAHDYYHEILEKIFFGCLNTKISEREPDLKQTSFNEIPYLNGGLFNPRENDFYQNPNQSVTIENKWFVEFYEILQQYNFTVDENTDLDVELSIDPEMLGRIFENLLAEINPETGKSARKATGSFYTPREIVSYMVDTALLRFLQDKTKIDTEMLERIIHYDETVAAKLTKFEREKIVDALANLKIFDPACGSGAFPMGILQKVFYLLQKVDTNGRLWYKAQMERQDTEEKRRELEEKFEDGNHDYIRKLGIIQQSIFGADIQPIAIEIAKLRCFLTLMIEEKVDDNKYNREVHPLPNLDFKFVVANTLKFLPENPNDPLNMFETGETIDLIKCVRNDYFLADEVGRNFLKAEFGGAQNQLTRKDAKEKVSCSAERYENLARWEPFQNRQTDWFDAKWMFGIEKFDIVIGNPPYGAKISEADQKYFVAKYQAAKPMNGHKGARDTFAFFIERGLDLLKQDGNLFFIVPLALTSNEMMEALQMKIESCVQTARIIAFANRPRQIFESACVRTAIIELHKTNSLMKNLYMTKLIRRERDSSIQDLMDNLEFAEAFKYKRAGRYPKVGRNCEIEILKKLFAASKNVGDYQDLIHGEEVYYRAAGGRYFNIVTRNSAETSAERKIYVQKPNLIAACLSTTLFWFYQQVYTDGLNLKEQEIAMFPVPDFEKVDCKILKKIEATYTKYLAEIEENTNIKMAAQKSRYNVQKFKEYKIAKSKGLIDELDNLIDPLYGLSESEVEYVKNYELKVRMRSESDAGRMMKD